MQDQFVGYGMPKWSLDLNHLFYADNTIIFYSANESSLKMIFKILKKYELLSGKKGNTDKSLFYMHKITARTTMEMMEQCIGMKRVSFLMKYLGCPITHTRKRKEHYSELIEKVKQKLQLWIGRLLFYGGTEVLITSILQSISIYILSGIIPPICVIKELHKKFR